MEPDNQKGNAAGRAHVAGVCRWNHAIVRAHFRSDNGAPVFFDDYDRAIREAHRNNGYVVGWASRLRPEHDRLCAELGTKLIRIEDGFIRSVGLGAGFVPACSLAVDERGIYYDASRPSDLEHALQHDDLDEADRLLGRQIRLNLTGARLSKYNLRGRASTIDPPKGTTSVLVVGQVVDDASIKLSKSATIDLDAAENINIQLLRAARRSNPRAYIVYKPHPDVVAGLRMGSVPDDTIRKYADISIPDANIVDLIDVCDTVETISSLSGFEAVLRGKTVIVHGSPFYAGWGLSHDLTPLTRRTKRRSLDELVFLSFAKYTRHMNPLTGIPCSVLELIDALQSQRESKTHRLRAAALGWIAWACENLNFQTDKR